jgi:hypothetical protein
MVNAARQEISINILTGTYCSFVVCDQVPRFIGNVDVFKDLPRRSVRPGKPRCSRLLARIRVIDFIHCSKEHSRQPTVHTQSSKIKMPLLRALRYANWTVEQT